ncbi:hypothetical protein [Streptomyces sp. GbtcB6]|uniref:hypothetical protein n=1 Tax=Streptomyces sp. GbtcB6 TaxID=2824751 RepID=UPI001C30482B|nr:hypothetical protein [Streptomyces sp. GbtcB6]
MAHLVLPAALGRHRRVVVAHSLVQRALTGARPDAGTAVPPPRKERPGGAPVAQAPLVAVVRGALSYDRGPRRRLIPLLPRLLPVVGLRLFPRSDGADELTLALRLSGVTAADRVSTCEQWVRLPHVEHLRHVEHVERLEAGPGWCPRWKAVSLSAGLRSMLWGAADSVPWRHAHAPHPELDPCR